MKVFKEKLDTIKTKKDLTKELKIYKQFIIKKIDTEEFNSALTKAKSALILIKEHQELFDLDKNLKEFQDLSEKVLSELNRHRDKYTKRLYRLLKENIDESNVEKLMKLLTSLKKEVDKNINGYNLEEVHANINRYFQFIKRLYIIFASYEIIDYFEVSENIFKFIEDLKFVDFPNLEKLSKSLLQKVIMRKLSDFSHKYKMLTISELSNELAISQEELIEFIYSILEESNSPIKAFIESKDQVIFNYQG